MRDSLVTFHMEGGTHVTGRFPGADSLASELAIVQAGLSERESQKIVNERGELVSINPNAVEGVTVQVVPHLAYNVGTVVKHSRFGIGVVRRVSATGTGIQLKIEFNDATRYLLAELAQLEVIR